MTDRYIATSPTGARIVRTNNLEEATRYADILRGEVLDLNAQDHCGASS